MWRNPKLFKDYLKRISSAKRFLNEGHIFFLSHLSAARRHRVYTRIKEVDPEGYEKLRSLRRKFQARARIEKFEPVRRALKENKLAIAQEEWEKDGITKFRFVQADAILDIIATFRGAGFSVTEVCEKMHVDPVIVNRVTPSMIKSAQRRFHDAIIHAADQKVYHDLMQGNVTEVTARADLIASRRRKIVLQAVGTETDRMKALLPAEQEAKDKSVADRFGVARKVKRKKGDLADESDETNEEGG